MTYPAKKVTVMRNVNVCGTCMYWDYEKIWGDPKNKAACRINPPLRRSGGMSCDANGEWPSTHNYDWCGRHSNRDPEKW